MDLSKRLQMVAGLVTKGNVVADVGCDHAYISIYLVENKVAPHTIALDVNQGPLQRATENILAFGYENDITTRLSDGLAKLTPGEADSIVIAGMGGALMIRILSEGEASVRAAKELILQPQSEIERVREYLHKRGYTITKENMCIDEGKFYTVLYVLPQAPWGSYFSKEEDKVFLKYGELLLKERHPILKDFLDKEYNMAQDILLALEKQTSEKSRARILELKEEMALMKEALQYYHNV